jgi:hypothetical protein
MRMFWRGQHLLRVARFAETSVVNDADAVGQLGNNRKVVRQEQASLPVVLRSTDTGSATSE